MPQSWLSAMLMELVSASRVFTSDKMSKVKKDPLKEHPWEELYVDKFWILVGHVMRSADKLFGIFVEYLRCTEVLSDVRFETGTGIRIGIGM
ncbi:hypothetical protein F2Q69_00042848 [Brassica cretica]|uniref:Uncharacterized protein n=1 Tax=Brassica cretica TaxID=69181 RepID=A0A8S9N5T9_BRACR|nr:hypothetical protein F2Q69_00042848 [Brassica cretica]